MPEKSKGARFGVNLYRIRTERGLTQKALAEAAGMNPNGLAKLERGEQDPSWTTVLALAAALGVDCQAFQTEGSDAPPPPAKPGRPKRRASGDPEPEVPTPAPPSPAGPKKRKPG